VQILNKKFYMSNPSILLVEESSPFSPIARINYEFYVNANELLAKLRTNSSIQCIVGKDHIAFGQSQYPSINDYADGVDMMNFLTNL
jgi:hypothetical protein